MDKFLNWKDFDVESKNPSLEAQKRWRSAASLVKNPRRRFRHVADLAKRSELAKKKQKIQVCIGFLSLFYLANCCIIWFDSLWKDVRSRIGSRRFGFVVWLPRKREIGENRIRFSSKTEEQKL